ncbi:MAG: beta-lactamase family protein [Mycobacterium sp.]|nr:beta-lactamase family protein [Mycobacterium sp.]
MTIKRLLAGVIATGLLASGCTADLNDRNARLDAAISSAMTVAKIPGALVGIWSPGGRYVRAFGVADTTSGTPMETDFFSRIGSLTKTFTATAVSRLAHEGKIGLDQPIGKYIDGVPNGDKISVRQLATMRSGLADYTKVEGFDKAVMANPQRSFPPRELLDWAFKQPAQFAPGMRFEYSNTNYILLGLLVERISGVSLPDYLTASVLDPLRLTHTIFPTGAQFPGPHARGYTDPDLGGAAVDATDWNSSITWAAGAMISTLEDLRTWVPALANGALRRTIAPDQPGQFAYGMGIFDVGGWIGHNGSVPGYQTVAVYLPERSITLVVMINTDIAAPTGEDPSEVLATAITSVITPDHVYALPPP